jgi:hypothetical protein
VQSGEFTLYGGSDSKRARVGARKEVSPYGRFTLP